MALNDELIKSQWETIDDYNVQKALYHLRRCDRDVQDFIADCCAALCDVSVDDMLSDTDIIYIAHARWLYWYAYRYMTNESYEKISISTARSHTFALRTIQSGVNKMSMMIANEALWKKRWTVVKHIIKLRENEEEVKRDSPIVINVPKELKEKIKIEIKDK